MSDYPDDYVPLNLDCGQCGLGIMVKPDNEGRALVHCDEEIVCPDCGATNQMGVEDDEDGDLDSNGDPIGTAYVSHWHCKHGVSEDDPCDACSSEEDPT